MEDISEKIIHLEESELDPVLVEEGDGAADFVKSRIPDEKSESEAPELKSMRLFMDGSEGAVDYASLYDVDTVLINAKEKKWLLDQALLAIMGETGCSSASVLEKKEEGKWNVLFSKGIQLDASDFFLDDSGFISLLKEDGKLIDMDSFRDVEKYSGDYVECLSIGGRYMVPVFFESELSAVFVLGDMLEEHTSEKVTGFITHVCRVTGVMLNFFNRLILAEKEAGEFRKRESLLKTADNLYAQCCDQKNSLDTADIVKKFFAGNGILSWCLFMQRPEDGSFVPEILEDEDFAGIRSEDVVIPADSLLPGLSGKRTAAVSVENFMEDENAVSAFGEFCIRRMSCLRIYPSVVCGSTEGFISVFKLAEGTDAEDVDFLMKKTAGFIFHVLRSGRDAGFGRYSDGLKSIFTRISREMENADRLGIPLSVLMISIKNFRRFSGAESVKIISSMEKIIRMRLGDTDFSVRYGRNRFLIVLPGKDKKLALQTGAAVRNAAVDIVTSVPVLLGFISAMYPDDGKDLEAIMDSLE